jgi:rhamnulokinase
MKNKSNVYLAVDLGAESGRVVAGRFDGRRLHVEEVYRFPNVPIEDNGSLHWDIEQLFGDIKAGITTAARRFGDRLISIGVDTWGLDYGLIDKRGQLLGKPFHYRDRRTHGMLENVTGLLGRKTVYDSTGVQFLPFNTLYQLAAEKAGSDSLDRADGLLFIADLINYWLTGRRVNERTIASTSQFYDPVSGGWANHLLVPLAVPTGILGDIAEPGTRLGPLLANVASETGARSAEVVLPGTHDTASAVAAVPAEAGDWAYICSGTWSLMGVEAKEPIITSRTRELGLTNEIGVCDTVRLLKNISGLWLVQQCRRAWEREGDPMGYGRIAEMAEAAPPFSAIINPDNETFLLPGDMPSRITAYCRQTGQEPPPSKGALIRTILEGLALRYREVLARLEETVGHSIGALHVVGGGAQNALLNQFTANCLNLKVIAGPVEATAVGNILMQLMAMGEIDSLHAGRDIIRRSFDLATYRPTDTGAWDAAYEQFLKLS